MSRNLIAAVALTLTLGGAAHADPAIYKKATPAVAWVVVEAAGEQYEGTAWVVDRQNRLLVTNHHVAGKAETMTLYFPKTRNGSVVTSRRWYLNSDTGVPAALVTSSAKKDLAVIQVDELPEGTPELKLAADSPEVGDAVHTVGHPGGKPKLWSGASDEVLRVGQVRTKLSGTQAVDVYAQVSRLQIGPGASGSPVLNDAGRVVGVVSGGSVDEKTGKAVSVMSVDVTEVKKVVATARQKLAAGPARTDRAAA